MGSTIKTRKLTKDGELFYPATSTNAVGHPGTRSSLTSLINSYNITTLWPSETELNSIDKVVDRLSHDLLEDQKVIGVKACFKNSQGNLEEWEFFGGGYGFNTLLGWREIDSSVTLELQEAVFPLGLSFSANTSIIEVGKSSNVVYSWSVTRKGQNVTSRSICLFDNQKVEGNSKTLSMNPTQNGPISYNLSASYQGLSKQATSTIYAVHLSYFGIIPGNQNSPSDITSMTKRLQASRNYTWDGINLSDQKTCYAYPKYFGKLGSIKDANNFEYLGSYILTEQDVNGVGYYIYTLKDPVTISNFRQTFS